MTIMPSSSQGLPFPDKYQHESGYELTLVPTRVLLAYTKPQENDHNEALQQTLELGFWELERVSGEENLAINNTEMHFWFRSSGEQAFSAQDLSFLQQQLGPQLDWIGPVYEFPAKVKARNSICLLPHNLLLRPLDPSTELGNKIDQLLLTRFGLVHVAEMTRLLSGFRFYSLPGEIRRREGTKTIFEVQQLLNETEYKKQGIRTAILDSMPMFLDRPRRRKRPPIHGVTPHYWAGLHGIIVHSVGFLDEPFVPGTGAGVTVAVIDADGFDLHHPAFQQAFVRGATFWPSTINPTGYYIDTSAQAVQITSGGSHGTCCAGIIGARQVPSKDTEPHYMVGFAPDSKIVPLYVKGYVKSLVAAAITYAADPSRGGAQVISISDSEVGLDDTSSMTNPIDAAIQYANSQHVLICAATMNRNMNEIHYPAGHPSVIACGASNDFNDRCHPPDWGNNIDGSNYGDSMSVVAPGVDIPTTDILNSTQPGDYRTFNGTSAATPQVAALAAILISTFPVLKNNSAQTREIIERSAQKLGRTTVGPPPGNAPINPPGPALNYSTIKVHGGWEREMGYGIISLLGAIQKAQELLGAGGDTVPPATPENLGIQ